MKRFELDLTFDASDMPRADFLRDIINTLTMTLLRGVPTANGVAILFQEILKNIHDHAEGRGYFRLYKRASELEFEIRDFGENHHDWNALFPDGVSTKRGNGINHGIGLGMIQGMAESLQIDLQIDTSRGFSYKGIWQFPSPSL